MIPPPAAAQVLLLRMLRPDKLVPALQAFVAASLGPRFTEPPPFDLAGSYKVGGSAYVEKGGAMRRVPVVPLPSLQVPLSIHLPVAAHPLCVQESSNTTPLLFVLSPGSDPTAALLSFAQSMGYGAKIAVISMGQGQVGVRTPLQPADTLHG